MFYIPSQMLLDFKCTNDLEPIFIEPFTQTVGQTVTMSSALGILNSPL